MLLTLRRFGPVLLLLALVLACHGSESSPGASAEKEAPPTPEATPPATTETIEKNVVSRGTEVCLRCGELREVRILGDGTRREERRDSKARDYSATCIEACARHDWIRTGCWYSKSGRSMSISCSRVPDGHPLWETLAALDDEPARELGRRFASFAPDRQRDVWANHARRMWRSTPRELARAMALDCGSPVLAARWGD